MPMFVGLPDPSTGGWIETNVKPKKSWMPWEFDISKSVQMSTAIIPDNSNVDIQMGEDDNTLILVGYNGVIRKYKMSNGNVDGMTLIDENTNQTLVKSLVFSSDGMKAFATAQFNTGYDTSLMKTINLTTPYDIKQIPTAVKKTNTALDGIAQDWTVCGISEDGTRMLCNYRNYNLEMWSVGTPFDMTTVGWINTQNMTVSNLFGTSASGTVPCSRMDPTGKILLANRYSVGEFRVHDLQDAWDTTPAKTTMRSQSITPYTASKRFCVNRAADKMYVCNFAGGWGNTVTQFNLTK